jgi:chaperone LolA
MLIRNLNKITILLTILLLQTMAYAKSGMLNAMDTLSVLLQETHTYSAEFKQEIYDRKGVLVTSAKGDIRVARPGKFYWKVTHPEPLVVVADGKVLWHYDVELAQVIKKDLAQALENSPAALLAGSLETLRQRFSADFMPLKNCSNLSDTCIFLESTEQDPLFTQIILSFKNKKLIAMEMNDTLGQKITIQYTGVMLNSHISPSFFKFNIPKKVDVIESVNN